MYEIITEDSVIFKKCFGTYTKLCSDYFRKFSKIDRTLFRVLTYNKVTLWHNIY